MKDPDAGNQPRSDRATWGLLLILIGFALVMGFARWQNNAEEIVPWREDLATGREEAAGIGKPVMVYFTAGWCGPCQQMRRSTWASPEVEAALSGYVPVKVDIDKHPEVAMRYAVESIPAMGVLDAEGRAVKWRVGYAEEGEMVDWLTRGKN